MVIVNRCFFTCSRIRGFQYVLSKQDAGIQVGYARFKIEAITVKAVRRLLTRKGSGHPSHL